jgi:hypothetical protein
MVEEIWFEELARRYPWFLELLKKTPYEEIEDKLGDYRRAYENVVKGPRGYNSGYLYKQWWDEQEKHGKLRYWFELFGEGEKLDRILEREAKEKRERDERERRMAELIKQKKAAERAAYESLVKS